MQKMANPSGGVSVEAEKLSVAEEAAAEVLNCVNPTLDSEEKRTDVIDYVQRLVKGRVNCEVVAFGSVPLKTYLPDGDIDLTILKRPKAGESLVHDVLAVLQDEERNGNGEYQVKETQFIDAEVKLVKCLMQNIVIDVSFNQLGGLSALCFLEQVDRLLGKNHLCKRSIILIKAWCYYESRIQGAHHGLLSTYALETLILCIFQIFHSELNSPLAVLYRFLDYYSQFDWENYGISLQGPICKSSLPNIVVKMPESGWQKLLTDDFLQSCREMFSVPSREIETQTNVFRIKHFNIIDPLKENNNLGRSVHRGNFYRIQTALKYGARKLGQILSRPKDEISEGLNKFFANTRSRHENHYRSSNQHLGLELDDDESWMLSQVEFLSEEDLPRMSSFSDFDNDSVGAEQTFLSESKNKSDRCSATEASSEMESEGCSLERNVPIGHGLSRSHSSSLLNNICQLDQVVLAHATDKSEMDSVSVGGELEVFNALADLTGDYDSHIRSFLCGQLCHLSTPAARNPPFVNEKPWDNVSEWMPFQPNTVSQVILHPQEKRKSRGTGMHLPQMVSYIERPFHCRYRNEVDANHNNCRRNQEPRRLGGGWHQSLHSFSHQDQVNGYLNSCRVQFGSVGNLKELVSSPPHGGYAIQGSGVATSTQQRVVGQSVRLKNDDEFPLCL